MIKKFKLNFILVEDKYSGLPLYLSMGIAIYSKSISTYRLFRNVDAALYKAKMNKCK